MNQVNIMKHWKKALVIVLVLALLLFLAGCSKAGGNFSVTGIFGSIRSSLADFFSPLWMFVLSAISGYFGVNKAFFFFKGIFRQEAQWTKMFSAMLGVSFPFLFSWILYGNPTQFMAGLIFGLCFGGIGGGGVATFLGKRQDRMGTMEEGKMITEEMGPRWWWGKRRKEAWLRAHGHGHVDKNAPGIVKDEQKVANDATQIEANIEGTQLHSEAMVASAKKVADTYLNMEHAETIAVGRNLGLESNLIYLAQQLEKLSDADLKKIGPQVMRQYTDRILSEILMLIKDEKYANNYRKKSMKMIAYALKVMFDAAERASSVSRQSKGLMNKITHAGIKQLDELKKYIKEEEAQYKQFKRETKGDSTKAARTNALKASLDRKKAAVKHLMGVKKSLGYERQRVRSVLTYMRNVTLKDIIQKTKHAEKREHVITGEYGKKFDKNEHKMGGAEKVIVNRDRQLARRKFSTEYVLALIETEIGAVFKSISDSAATAIDLNSKETTPLLKDMIDVMAGVYRIERAIRTLDDMIIQLIKQYENFDQACNALMLGAVGQGQADKVRKDADNIKAVLDTDIKIAWKERTEQLRVSSLTAKVVQEVKQAYAESQKHMQYLNTELEKTHNAERTITSGLDKAFKVIFDKEERRTAAAVHSTDEVQHEISKVGADVTRAKVKLAS